MTDRETDMVSLFFPNPQQPDKIIEDCKGFNYPKNKCTHHFTSLNQFLPAVGFVLFAEDEQCKVIQINHRVTEWGNNTDLWTTYSLLRYLSVYQDL